MTVVNSVLNCCGMDRGSNLVLVLACVGLAMTLLSAALPLICDRR